MVRVVQKLDPMLKSTEKHREVFPEPSFIAFTDVKILKTFLLRSKLYNVEDGVCDSSGCSPIMFCVVLQRLFPVILKSSVGLIFRLIVTRQMWYVCWNVVFVAYNLLAVHVLR